MKRAAGVLTIKEGRVLLVRAGLESRQPTGQISFPGGDVEIGETEKDAASREFIEETGLIATRLIDFPGNYVETVVPRKNVDEEYSFKVYLVQEFSGELKATPETEPFWVDIGEAKKLPLYGKNNQILEDAVKFLDQKS